MNFNQVGQEYQALAIAGDPKHHNMISKEGAQFFECLEKHLISEYKVEENRKNLDKWISALDYLRAFMYQVSKIKIHSDKIHSSVPAEPGTMICISGSDALTDFESLLYLARSALDKLTFAIAKRTYNQNCDKFNKLGNILKGRPKDQNAKDLVLVIEAVIESFRGTLINYPSTDSKDRSTGLRSLFAHSRATEESLDHGFVCHRIDKRKALLLDLELDGHGLISVSHTLNKNITYLMLNCISIYSGYNKTITLSDCEPSWVNSFVCISKYESSSSSEQITVVKPDRISFSIINKNIDPKIYKKAISI
ncbi:hypothetical protein [Oceanospirillum beijerinckii]|uniref:hypothetical protein n=1 Tax=Oceanospirillum beijerinckii TaxID=64976 RepID=UPI0003FB3F92|nr:hypothetical protein [Oceanospirillum beijerinckii]